MKNTEGQQPGIRQISENEIDAVSGGPIPAIIAAAAIIGAGVAGYAIGKNEGGES